MKITEQEAQEMQANCERGRKGISTPVEAQKPALGLSVKPCGRGMTRTEAEYGIILKAEFPGCPIFYEGLTLKLLSGHKYTPDWVIRLPEGKILCIEVKNAAYKHASYGRARLAFDCAKTEWPFKFRWVVKTKEGWIEKGESRNE